jgi:hypothetical protein
MEGYGSGPEGQGPRFLEGSGYRYSPYAGPPPQNYYSGPPPAYYVPPVSCGTGGSSGGETMRTVLIIGVALSVLAASSAHARPGLPDTMLGGWCPSYDDEGSDDEGSYVRGSKHNQDPDCLTVRRTNYDRVEGRCVFKAVKRIRPGFYLVDARCEGEASPVWSEKIGFELSKGELFISWPRTGKGPGATAHPGSPVGPVWGHGAGGRALPGKP